MVGTVFFVRIGELTDLVEIKSIASTERATLGFVMRPKIKDALKSQRVLVADSDTGIVGFVIYRHRKTDDQTTLSEICVARTFRGQGIGKALLTALYTDCQKKGRLFIQLKCPADLSANDFYEHVGWTLHDVEEGKKRLLNVWRLEVAKINSPQG